MSDLSPPNSPAAAARAAGLTPEEVTAHTFPSARRGLDPDAVRAFLAEVAEQLRRAERREAELSSRLHQAEQPVPAPPLDAAALSAAVGQETARVLQAAHEAADEVIASASLRAEERLKEAELVFDAEMARAAAASTQIADHARNEAQAKMLQTREECRQMVESARAARRRILGDLAHRRHELHVQLEQLRAGKDVLADVVDAVAAQVVEAVGELKGRLAGAEEEARRGAEGAASAAHLYGGEVSEEELLGEAEELSAAESALADDVGLFNSESPLPVDEVVTISAIELIEPIEPIEPTETESAGTDGAIESVEAEIASPVDELFAKIRQSRTEQVAHARHVLNEQLDGDEASIGTAAVPLAEALSEETASEDDEIAVPLATTIDPGSELTQSDGSPQDASPGGQASPSGEVSTQLAGAETTTSERGSTEEDAAQVRAGDPSDAPEGTPQVDSVTDASAVATSGGDEDAPSSEEAEEESRSAEDDEVSSMRSARDEILAPSTAELARTIKRHLRLEQNELLDSFRNLKKGVAPGALLPGEEMRSRLAQSTEEAIAAAFRGGRDFADQYLGRTISANRRQSSESTIIATDLAATIVEGIRRRLEVGLLEREEEASAAIGAAFREWKGPSADQAAEDSSIRAYSLGVLSVAKAAGAPIKWVVDDGDMRCPDCDDNAIAGSQTPGKPFPTGHQHPPIHPGCRCLLVPSLG